MVTAITPARVTTDGHDSYPRAIRTEREAVSHRRSASPSASLQPHGDAINYANCGTVSSCRQARRAQRKPVAERATRSGARETIRRRVCLTAARRVGRPGTLRGRTHAEVSCSGRLWPRLDQDARDRWVCSTPLACGRRRERSRHHPSARRLGHRQEGSGSDWDHCSASPGTRLRPPSG